jgi:hypothetical protein
MSVVATPFPRRVPMLKSCDADYVSARNEVCNATSLQQEGAFRTRQRDRQKRQAPRVCPLPPTLWTHCSNIALGTVAHTLPQDHSPPCQATQVESSAGGSQSTRVMYAPSPPRLDAGVQGMYIDRLLDDERPDRDTRNEDLRYGVGGVSVSRPIPNGHGMSFIGIAEAMTALLLTCVKSLALVWLSFLTMPLTRCAKE